MIDFYSFEKGKAEEPWIYQNNFKKMAAEKYRMPKRMILTPSRFFSMKGFILSP